MSRFVDDIIQGLERLSTTRFNNMTDMANKIEASQPVLWKLINRKASPRIDVVGKMMDTLGVKLVWPDEVRDRTKECVFVSPVATLPGGTPPKGQDYRAIPIVSQEDVQGQPEAWVLVGAREPAIQFRKNVVAVRIAPGQHDMEPTLQPGDLVIVDLDDKAPAANARSMFLVRDRDGRAAVKRVNPEEIKGGSWLVYYSDNPQHAPTLHSLDDDFGGEITRAISGRVVMAWTDMTHK